MNNYLTKEYRGFKILCTPSETHREHGHIRVIWNVAALKDDEVRGSWPFDYFKTNPFYLAMPEEVLKSGEDLVDKILNHK